MSEPIEDEPIKPGDHYRVVGGAYRGEVYVVHCYDGWSLINVRTGKVWNSPSPSEDEIWGLQSPEYFERVDLKVTARRHDPSPKGEVAFDNINRKETT